MYNFPRNTHHWVRKLSTVTHTSILAPLSWGGRGRWVGHQRSGPAWSTMLQDSQCYPQHRDPVSPQQSGMRQRESLHPPSPHKTVQDLSQQVTVLSLRLRTHVWHCNVCRRRRELIHKLSSDATHCDKHAHREMFQQQREDGALPMSFTRIFTRKYKG